MTEKESEKKEIEISLVVNESFEDFIKEKDRAFFLFGNIKQTKHLFNEEDLNKFQSLQNHYFESYTRVFFGTLVAGQILTLGLKYRNPLYRITYQLNFWGVLKKYMIIPYCTAQTCRLLFFKFDFLNGLDKIVKSYDYDQLEIRQAYEEIKQNKKVTIYK